MHPCLGLLRATAMAVVVLVLSVSVGMAQAEDVPRCVPEERYGPQTLPAGYSMTATVQDRASGLSSDGLGPYVDGLGVGGVFGAWALNLFTWAGSDGLSNRVRSGYQGPPQWRALRFDLGRPVPGSGAMPLGPVVDSVGRFHAFWRDLQDVRTVVPILLMRVRDTVTIDRVELFVRAAGHQYVLQFGPWTMGRYSTRGGGTIHGDGTTRAAAERLRYERWIIRSAPNSVGRLWLFDDPQKPADRGLYYFDFVVQFDCRS